MVEENKENNMVAAAAFNMAVDLYTELLFEQKDLLFRVIETSYAKGYATAQRDIALAMEQAAEEEQVHHERKEQEHIQPPIMPHDSEKFTDRLKAGMPRR